MGFPGGSVVKNLPANAGDLRATDSESGRSPGGRNSTPLQYSCLKNSRQKSLTGYSLWAAKSQTWL